MPYTVWVSFDNFRKNKVDLDKDEVSKARSSRDFLFDQLKLLQTSVSGFPTLYGSYLSYGSFARKTKKRPLDDVDSLLLLNGRDTTAQTAYRSSDPYEYWLRLNNSSSPLHSFRDDHGFVSSIKVMNKIRDSLGTISQYNKAEIKRNGQAITLNLRSYPWSFDIVPAVPISGSNGTAYYLIPDGTGDWMRTDPRIDSANVTAVNATHGGYFLPLVRILKAWNERVTKPKLDSYYFETLALNAFRYAQPIGSFQEGVKVFFDRCQSNVYGSCPDPKGLGPHLDAGITFDTKSKVAEAMKMAGSKAWWAIYHEGKDEHKEAIGYWQTIFGPDFPSYG